MQERRIVERGTQLLLTRPKSQRPPRFLSPAGHELDRGGVSFAFGGRSVRSEMLTQTVIEGARAGRIGVANGQLLEIINVEGKQVCDFFAFNSANIREALSPSHTRSVMRRIVLIRGDRLYSVLRRPMFELVEDTVGQNDFTLPACDPERYRMDFDIKDHRSCRTNLDEVMREDAIPYEYLPEPFNFFQPTPINPDGSYGTGTSPALPGDKIVLRALMDVIAVASSCPQDQIPLNDFHPSALRLVVRHA
jgi:uncharacterized protein YcgI (DUF1989 family)